MTDRTENKALKLLEACLTYTQHGVVALLHSAWARVAQVHSGPGGRANLNLSRTLSGEANLFVVFGVVDYWPM